jgi:hypothetical protein
MWRTSAPSGNQSHPTKQAALKRTFEAREPRFFMRCRSNEHGEQAGKSPSEYIGKNLIANHAAFLAAQAELPQRNLAADRQWLERLGDERDLQLYRKGLDTTWLAVGQEAQLDTAVPHPCDPFGYAGTKSVIVIVLERAVQVQQESAQAAPLKKCHIQL